MTNEAAAKAAMTTTDSYMYSVCDRRLPMLFFSKRAQTSIEHQRKFPDEHPNPAAGRAQTAPR